MTVACIVQIADFGASKWPQLSTSTGLATYTTDVNQHAQMSYAWAAPEVKNITVLKTSRSTSELIHNSQASRDVLHRGSFFLSQPFSLTELLNHCNGGVIHSINHCSCLDPMLNLINNSLNASTSMGACSWAWLTFPPNSVVA